MALNLDVNATYGLLPEVVEALRQLPGDCLNPSSIHRAGQRARALIENVRQKFRDFTGLHDDYEIIFNSGATEGNNTVINTVCGSISKATSVVSNRTEHSSVLEPLEAAGKRGAKISWINPQTDAYLQACDSDTSLVCCMFANNETGNCYPVAEIFKELRRNYPEILLHCDAVQALGKCQIDFSTLAADYMTFSTHKIGALMGLGILATKKECTYSPLLVGGPQESRRRAGTENLWGIYSLGVALDVWQTRQDRIITGMLKNKSYLLRVLQELIPTMEIQSQPEELSLPNTLSVTFPGCRADDLLVGLDIAGIYASAGSACSSGKPDPSHVLLALGLTLDQARSTIRLSLKGSESPSELEFAAQTICRLVRDQK